MEVSAQVFDIICRACLSESNTMKSLYCKLEGTRLIDLLKITANIEYCMSDDLPSQLCINCEDFLHKSEEFRRRCRESETVLRNVCPAAFLDSSNKNNENFDKKEFTVPSDQGPLEEKPFSSLFGNNEMNLTKFDKATIEKDVKTEFVEKVEDDYFDDFEYGEDIIKIPVEFDVPKKSVKTYKCSCEQEFKSKLKYKEHLKTSNCNKKRRKSNKGQEKLVSNAEINSTSLDKNSLACPKCDLLFDSINSWSIHQLSHVSPKKPTKDIDLVCPKDKLKVGNTEESKVQCSQCLRKFKSKKSLIRHLKRHEANDNVKHTCGKCKREFKYKTFLETHILRVHTFGANGYSCEYCPEKFSSSKSLELHVSSHSKKKNPCPFCNKSFLLLCTLKDHLRIHTGEKPFLCSICGKGFSQKANLGQHMRRHMGVKPFTCHTCNMSFVSKGELDAHTRKHTGAHPFICDDCGSGFTTASALKKHRRTHTGEKPYSCDLCPRTFAAISTLKNHRRTHTGERPYQCSHCKKSFIQRSDLVSHIRCHTGERPFVCPHCGQAFRKAAAMKTHVKMHARETELGMAVAMPGTQV